MRLCPTCHDGACSGPYCHCDAVIEQDTLALPFASVPVLCMLTLKQKCNAAQFCRSAAG